MQADDKRGPGVRFPPPLLALCVVGGAWLLDYLVPLPIAGDGPLTAIGIALIVLASALALLSVIQFFAARTHVEPWRPTTAIILHGVYRFSRNPIYLAFVIATLGAGLALDSWWIVGAAAPLLFLLQRFVIRLEEAYLENKFGEAYLAYKRSTRRWL
jgi:protein-S-isoprenylcysteine O-methyltransferase Ste14